MKLTKKIVEEALLYGWYVIMACLFFLSAAQL